MTREFGTRVSHILMVYGFSSHVQDWLGKKSPKTHFDESL
jgi:hypothetical protein